MKVIMLKDVKGIGRAHEAVVAADGYALNYLIPKKLAVAATSSAMKDAEMRLKQVTDRVALDAALFAKSMATLASAKIVLKAKANEKEHLYDAIGESEIKKAVQEQVRIDLPEGAIRLEKPLKKLGTFDVPISAAGAFGKFSITIEAE